MNNGSKDYKEKILVVDDEIPVCEILDIRLSISGYIVFIAKNSQEAISIFREKNPDLVILDLMLPKLAGYDIYNELRKNSNVPVIILTALGDISDRVMGLEFGADDYLSKPFSPKELEARIRSVLRRINRTNPKTSKPLLYFNSLTIDINKKQIFKKGKQIHLTEIEYNLMELLILNAGKTVSREHIFSSIWGYVPFRYLDTRIVDVHISRLRAKLENDVRNPDLILTARGVGYMFTNFQKIAQ